jgi:hypothetical protein
VVYRYRTKGMQWIWIQTRFQILNHQFNSTPHAILGYNQVVSLNEIMSVKDTLDSNSIKRQSISNDNSGSSNSCLIVQQKSIDIKGIPGSDPTAASMDFKSSFQRGEENLKRKDLSTDRHNTSITYQDNEMKEYASYEDKKYPIQNCSASSNSFAMSGGEASDSLCSGGGGNNLAKYSPSEVNLALDPKSQAQQTSSSSASSLGESKLSFSNSMAEIKSERQIDESLGVFF